MGKLEDMALLVAVAEAGSLSAAGRRLSLSPATMTARLKAIEERYQTRLFHRSTRSLTLTRAGEEFYHAALRVLLARPGAGRERFPMTTWLRLHRRGTDSD